MLATASVGRLALSVRALPLIVPVQYYLDGRRLALCLGHHELPERALDETVVAFAADSIDPVTRSGWSVQVQGRSVISRGLRIDTDSAGLPLLRWWRWSRRGSAASGCTCARSSTRYWPRAVRDHGDVGIQDRNSCLPGPAASHRRTSTDTAPHRPRECTTLRSGSAAAGPGRQLFRS